MLRIAGGSDGAGQGLMSDLVRVHECGLVGGRASPRAIHQDPDIPPCPDNRSQGLLMRAVRRGLRPASPTWPLPQADQRGRGLLVVGRLSVDDPGRRYPGTARPDLPVGRPGESEVPIWVQTTQQ